jgi:hypothetical protein
MSFLEVFHAQLCARAYGFDRWPRLKVYVNGVTVKRLADAVRAGDIAQVRAMLKARPEPVNMDMEINEHRALHAGSRADVNRRGPMIAHRWTLRTEPAGGRRAVW